MAVRLDVRPTARSGDRCLGSRNVLLNGWVESRSNPVSEHIRNAASKIVELWTAAVAAELPRLAALERSAIINHLPEFMIGLANFIDQTLPVDGGTFTTLLEGHARQRLTNGIDLSTLIQEYALLRSVLMRVLRDVPTTPEIRDPMIRLDEGLDTAVRAAVQSYATLRDQTRDRFIGILAHDLRTPLSAVMTGANYLTAITESDDVKHRVAVAIEQSATRMARLIDDIFEFARGTLGGTIPVQFREGDLGELAAIAVAELKVAHPKRDLRLELIGDLRGRWDADRILQVVSNLVANAFRHGADPVTVTVREGTSREELVLEVNDRGPPLPAERIRQLFDPTRLEVSKTRAGLGLGLYIVRQIALAHGARCDVQSSEAEGTTFTVRWPRALSA